MNFADAMKLRPYVYVVFPSGVWYLFPPLLDRYRGLLRLSESIAVLARAMPSVSNLVDRQMGAAGRG